MVCVSYLIVFLFGVCVGGIIVYKIEKHNFSAMTSQRESLAIEEERLRRERNEYYETRDMVDVIDDLPEYLLDKYDISENDSFTENDEDLPEIYT